MDTITILWFLPASFMLVISLYISLERLSKKNYKDKGSHYFRQTIFLLIIGFVCIGIDRLLLPSIFGQFSLGNQIENTIRFLLFPILAYFLAMVFGAKKEAKITRESIRKRRER